MNNALSIPQSDLSLMMQQSENETSTMIAGMFSIISDNEKLNDGLQNQSWCKRMFNTILGKNKATALEIRQNHDKLSAYVAQAVAELYDRNRISNQIMVSLALQITQLYGSHLELKSMLYSLANRLNEKIESIDNFHTLMEEIDEGIYGNEPGIANLLVIISQIDRRMAADPKKMRLLERKLFNKNLLSMDCALSIKSILDEISNLQDDDLSAVYADLQLYRTDYIVADLAVNVIESWNLLSLPNRKLLKKQNIIDRIILDSGVDESVEIDFSEFYDQMIDIRQNLFDEAKNAMLPEKEITEENPTDSGNTGNAIAYSKVCPLCKGKLNIDEAALEKGQVSCKICGYIIDLNDLLLDESDGNEVDENEEAEYEEPTEESEEDSDNGTDISDTIADYVDLYLGADDNCRVYTGYISYDLREKAKKNIVDKQDKLTKHIYGGLGALLLGPAGFVAGEVLGNNAGSVQEYTCDTSDIIAIVDSSSSHNCKEGLVFTRVGVFFSQTADVSVFVRYDDIRIANGTNGFWGGKLQVERYTNSAFTWTATLIPKDKLAQLLNSLKSLC